MLTASTVSAIGSAHAAAALAPAAAPLPRTTTQLAPVADPLLAPPAAVRRVATVGLVVSDLDRATAFYEEAVGLRVAGEAPGRALLRAGAGHHELELIAGRGGYDHVGLEVRDARTLERCAGALRARGCRVGAVHEAPGIDRRVDVTAPGGHRLALVTGLGAAGGAPGAARPRRAQRLDHVNFLARRPGVVEGVLSAELGLCLSAREGRARSFWDAGDAPFAVAVSTAAVNRLHHHAWTFADAPSLVAAGDRVAAAGGDVVWGIGRHGAPTGVAYLYVSDPDGHLVELCAPATGEAPRRWGARMPLRFATAGCRPARYSRRPRRS